MSVRAVIHGYNSLETTNKGTPGLHKISDQNIFVNEKLENKTALNMVLLVRHWNVETYPTADLSARSMWSFRVPSETRRQSIDEGVVM
jgi:hypothetical protein